MSQDGKLLDRELAGRGSTPVADIYNPPPQPLSSAPPTCRKAGVEPDQRLDGHSNPRGARSGG